MGTVSNATEDPLLQPPQSSGCHSTTEHPVKAQSPHRVQQSLVRWEGALGTQSEKGNGTAEGVRDWGLSSLPRTLSRLCPHLRQLLAPSSPHCTMAVGSGESEMDHP